MTYEEQRVIEVVAGVRRIPVERVLDVGHLTSEEFTKLFPEPGNLKLPLTIAAAAEELSNSQTKK